MIHHQPPTVQQAQKLIRHYDIQPGPCKRHKSFTSCTGTQSVCVYHGNRCVPSTPISYRFKLWWKGDTIMVSLHWETEL
jgi:hypothetical protein